MSVTVVTESTVFSFLSWLPSTDGPVAESYFSSFRRAQRTVERRAYRLRKQLLFFEKQRNKSAVALGLDPYLDLPG